MNFRFFEDGLCQEAKAIRQEIFCQEQGFSLANEFDQTDSIAAHLVLYEDTDPVATCRIFPGEVQGTYVVGRLAVRKSHRGRQLGRELLQLAEAYVRRRGGRKLALSAQIQAQGFYEKCGFAPMGEVYLDEFCPHIHMEKELTA